MSRGLPGSTPPQRRVPVDVRGLRDGARPAAAAVLAKLRPRRGTFPLSAPTWPTSVPRPPAARDLGVDYDTEWARRTPARVARLLLGELVTRPVLSAVASPAVAGADRVAHLDEPVVFAANHASHLDTPLLLSVLPERWRHRTVVAGAADYFFDNRVKAALFALTINAIPIERLRVSRTSANRAARLLEDGWSLLIFPEGGRSPDGWGQSHRPGAAWLSVRTGRPVVPVHIEGTGRILPRHAGAVHPGSTTVTFGRPIRPRDGDDARQLAVRIESAIAALADEQAGDWWAARRRAAAGTTPQLTGPEGTGAWRRSWALGATQRRNAVRPGPATARWPKR